MRNFTTTTRGLVVAVLAVAALAGAPAVAEATVYWGNYTDSRIGSVGNDGTSPLPGYLNVGSPMGLAAFEGDLYWADYDNGRIGRADVSGGAATNVVHDLVADVPGVWAVAVDEAHLYWGTDGGEIWRAPIGTGGALGTPVRIADRLGGVRGLAIGDGAIYFSDDGSDDGLQGIGSVTFAVAGPVVEEDLVTPNGAAGIAVAGSHIYWANTTGGSIGRALIDPTQPDGVSDVTQLFIPAADPVGLAVSGRDVVWTSVGLNNSSLNRARLDDAGGPATPLGQMLTDPGEVVGVAIDNPVDREAPVITATHRSPDNGSWFNGVTHSDVRVDVSASDLMSGVTSLTCTDSNGVTVMPDTSGAPGYFRLGDGRHSISCTATDGASNRGAGHGSTPFPVVLNVDLAAPSISCSSAPGDWSPNNVVFGCSASDDLSGLANPLADAAFTLTTSVPAGAENGAAPSDTRNVSDAAGNMITAGPQKAKVDRAGPSIACPVPALVLELGGPATPVVAVVSDGGSGAASPTATGVTSTAVAGDHTTAVSAADKVGNRTSTKCAYSVKDAPPPTSKYVFKGLRKLHHRSFRYGSHIPLRFRLWDQNGKPVKNAVARLSVVKADGEAVVARVAGRASGSRAGDTFRHIGRGRYRLVLDTRTLPGPGSYEVRVTLDDGSVHSAPLKLRAGRNNRHDHDHEH